MSTVMLWTVVLAANLALATACAPTGPPISEEERCTRFGGIWRVAHGFCEVPGGGGGGM